MYLEGKLHPLISLALYRSVSCLFTYTYISLSSLFIDYVPSVGRGKKGHRRGVHRRHYIQQLQEKLQTVSNLRINYVLFSLMYSLISFHIHSFIHSVWSTTREIR